MAEWFVKALIIGFAAWAVWSLVRPRYVFEIRVRGGEPCVRRGRVTRAFLDRVAEVCQTGGISRGWVCGVQCGPRIALRFSRHFPAALRQRLRNGWQALG